VSAGNRQHSRRSSPQAEGPELGAFRGRHLDAAKREIMTGNGRIQTVTVNDGESPLVWLYRRKGRDGQPMINATQFVAGERLRADFTRANLMPGTTSRWEVPTSSGTGAKGGAGAMTDAVIASRQRVQLALKSCGPEFSGLLLDVCCFLRRLEDVEQSRGWPARSAKVVLQLGLDRLARHYGLKGEIAGDAAGPIRSWKEGAGAARAPQLLRR